MTHHHPGRRRWARNAGILLASCFILAFSLAPFLWIVITSITEEQNVFGRIVHYFPSSPTVANYGELFRVVNFGRSFRNSVFVAVTTTTLALATSLFAAYALARLRFPGRQVIVQGMLMVYLMPSIILVVPLLVIFKNLQLINTLPSLILAEATHTAPFATWLLMGYFSALPRELEESALVDGCTHVGALLRITLPLALPGIVAAGLFVFIAAWNNFLFAYMFTSGDAVRTLPVLMRSFALGEPILWGTSTAGAVLASLPVLFLGLFFQRYLIGGLAAGAVKG